MKTVNGVPQFDLKKDWITSSSWPILDDCNKQLVEWEQQRRCVKCKHFESFYCTKIGIYLGAAYRKVGSPNPETFSCAKFEVLT